MCTVPSGATARMSLFDLFELNVIEWSPMTYQVTDPPTGILIVFGPNSSIEPGPFGGPSPRAPGSCPGS